MAENKKKKRKKHGSFQGSRINPKYFSRGQIKFYIILLPLAVFMALPIVILISRAFMELGELNHFPPHIIVHNPTWTNFKALFKVAGTSGVPMTRYLYNSVVVTLLTVLLNLIITVSGAYVFAKKNFKGKKTLFEINQLALMFVPTAVAVPRFLIIKNMGIIDTWWAHILPLVAMPVGLFLVKQFVDQIPDALIEAAIVDGAKDMHIIFKIIIPLTKPALATSVVLTFQQVWGAVEASNYYMNSETMKTLVFYMNSLGTNNTVAAMGMQAAAAVIMTLPNIIIFVIMQSQVMNTMSHSGIK